MHEEKELILKKEVYAVVGAAMEVHNELGHGFLEAVYHSALKIELKALDKLTGKEESQILNYLKATRLRVGC